MRDSICPLSGKIIGSMKVTTNPAGCEGMEFGKFGIVIELCSSSDQFYLLQRPCELTSRPIRWDMLGQGRDNLLAFHEALPALGEHY